MLWDGVIEESNSPWSSLIVAVPKPDGNLRLCNNYRRLNVVLTFDSYLLPRVESLIERLGNTRFIPTLDLTKGYWQVPLHLKCAKRQPSVLLPVTGSIGSFPSASMVPPLHSSI